MRNKLHQWKPNPGSFDACLATFRKIVEQRRTCSCTSLYLHRCCDLESQNVGTFLSWKKLEKSDLFFASPEILSRKSHISISWNCDNSFKLPTCLSAKKNIRSKLQLPVSSVGNFTFAATTGHQIPAPSIKILDLLWVEPASGGIWSTFFSVAKPLRHCWC